MKQIKYTLLLASLLMFSACGYHLRSSLDLPKELKTVYIEGASGQLRNILKKSLRSSVAKLVNHASEAGIVIKVVKEKMRNHVLSLNASGRANEYELYYVLDFLLLDAKGNVLTETQSIEITRDYFNNQEELLGKYNEEQVIRDEMYYQAVSIMLNRSRIVLKQMAQ